MRLLNCEVLLRGLLGQWERIQADNWHRIERHARDRPRDVSRLKPDRIAITNNLNASKKHRLSDHGQTLDDADRISGFSRTAPKSCDFSRHWHCRGHVDGRRYREVVPDWSSSGGSISNLSFLAGEWPSSACRRGRVLAVRAGTLVNIVTITVGAVIAYSSWGMRRADPQCLIKSDR
jgi:hypothetical protein